MIKVAIVDDIKTVRSTIVSKIKLSPDMTVIKEFSNGKEALHAVMQGMEADIIIMDIEMPEMDGIEATEKILAKYPNTKILMCTVFDDETNLFKAICAGAKGYLLKDEKPEKIHRAIFETMEGGSAMSASIALKSLNLIKNATVKTKTETTNTDSNLTKREVEMLELIATGMSYEQVADNAGISYGTVRKHLENIYRKLNVHSKLEAVNKAQKDGLL
ncbi:MAG: DNA-binding response regulator [Bacteroidetes bacterium]|jgi:DNA-binding NarL/FixJ family response regulator|nr:DNA-binding response regulator [Bacteroidota bacterium]